MINFYAIPASLYCAKTRICLRHKHLIWTELPPPGGFGSDVYTSHIPSGTLPGLIDGETTLGDSEAIAEYLEEAYPSFPMLPKTINDRAKIRELSRFHDTRLEPCIRALFAHVPPKEPAQAYLAEHSKLISQRIKQLETLLHNRPKFGLSLGDCGFPVTFAWIEALKPVLNLSLTIPDAVQKYLSWVVSTPAVAEELSQYKPVLQAWFAVKGARCN